MIFWIKCSIILLVGKLLLLSLHAFQFYTVFLHIRWHFYKNYATFKDGEGAGGRGKKLNF